MSSCQVLPPSGSISPCAATSSCNNNIKNYMLSGFANYKTEKVIGIAKDGHIVFGPYSNFASLVTGQDVCNGVFFDSDLNYGLNYEFLI